MHPRFEQFIREKQILVSVTPATVEWYRRCLKWLPSAEPTQQDLRAMVVRMRETGLKETGVNTVIRCVNAYLHWSSGSDRRCGPGCVHPRIARLREPKLVMPTFTEPQVKRLISWRPSSRYERRLHLVILFLLDTGCRISEALGVRVSDINFDDMLVTLDGKGRRQRIIPISIELRKSLFRAVRGSGEHSFVFPSDSGTPLHRRNVLRDVKMLCYELGFDPPGRTLHAFRHTFAVNYLRRGGSVFHLQKVLGHSSLEMTRRYANLVTADLQAVHERVSLLSK
ncbi:MAG TPA: site-specific integrase [Terracidiphilus sp.]|nr:site-specific integrase [Terracidiphilus sp.]